MDAAPLTIFWFRRDLRLNDNHGLSLALKAGGPLLPLFIFDKNILKSLAGNDARVTFIHQTLEALDQELREHGQRLFVFHGKPLEVFEKLVTQHKISAVYTNEDYEPYAIKRDAEVADFLKGKGIAFQASKDHVVFAKNEVTKDDGSPYRVYTPYSRRWLEELKLKPVTSFNSLKALKEAGTSPKIKHENPTLKDLGFQPSMIPVPSLKIGSSLLSTYAEQRDFMALDATSKAGLHLRFGTLSVREAIKAAKASEVWLKELIWREFFSMILFHFPRTVSEPFDAKFQAFPWRENAEDFKRWCEGQTGYPIVDAGMRELNATGFMHNRARMIVGSFLTKHLLIHWKQGERYFAEKLFDFDLASNVGNWQWVAGCGVDAAPYFRIFNPALQTKKFDGKQAYIKKWVPEINTTRYPDPIVDHEHARRRALVAYDKIRIPKAAGAKK